MSVKPTNLDSHLEPSASKTPTVARHWKMKVVPFKLLASEKLAVSWCFLLPFVTSWDPPRHSALLPVAHFAGFEGRLVQVGSGEGHLDVGHSREPLKVLLIDVHQTATAAENDASNGIGFHPSLRSQVIAENPPRAKATKPLRRSSCQGQNARAVECLNFAANHDHGSLANFFVAM